MKSLPESVVDHWLFYKDPNLTGPPWTIHVYCSKGFLWPVSASKKGGMTKGKAMLFKGLAGITRRAGSGYSSPVAIIACGFLIVFSHNNPAGFLFCYLGGRS